MLVILLYLVPLPPALRIFRKYWRILIRIRLHGCLSSKILEWVSCNPESKSWNRKILIAACSFDSFLQRKEWWVRGITAALLLNSKNYSTVYFQFNKFQIRFLKSKFFISIELTPLTDMRHFYYLIKISYWNLAINQLALWPNFPLQNS